MSSTKAFTIEAVKDYYGRVLGGTEDLQTSACCTAERLLPHLAAIEALVHPEVKEKFYGCGAPLPPALEGATVLDLGCGSGRDTFILSKLVGPQGKVIGVDMTPAQLSVAEKYLEYHQNTFGLARPNVRLACGYIEDLAAVGIESGSVDVVVSNCVVNLSPDKPRVFAEVFRVLKPGGELYFSDVFAGRRVPAELQIDPVFIGECLGGALYLEDFRRLLGAIGIFDHRVVNQRRLTLDNPDLAARSAGVEFYSMTVRAFQLDLEDVGEDYGQTARYLGTLPEYPDAFVLDEQFRFATGQAVPVCGNTAAMLGQTRYRSHFELIGDRRVHRGRFGTRPVAAKEKTGCC